jgi:hypothetical protein
MGLDKGLDKNMVNACNAYMQNTPGSKKALRQIFSEKKVQKVLAIKQLKEEIKHEEENETKNIKTIIKTESSNPAILNQIKYKVSVKTGMNY